MRILTTGVLGVLLAATAVEAQDLIPEGDQFQVNSYTTSYQYAPSVAAMANSNFVVVWESLGSSDTDDSYWSILGQSFDASGAPVGGEFQVNSYTTDYQIGSAVASDSLGNFVVVWESVGSFGTDTSYWSIQGQRYDGSGTPVGGQFQVNSYTTSYQLRPAVSGNSLGSFMMVWESLGSSSTDLDGWSVQGQLYDADGAPVEEEFQVNSYTTDMQTQPAVATSPDGGFVVVWASAGSYDSDTHQGSVQGQRYDASGAPVGGQFQINSYTTDSQHSPAVSARTDGGFVVVWESIGSAGTDTDFGSIQGQRLDSTGTPVGEQFQVNTYTTRDQRSPAVAIDPVGNFVVVWESYGSAGTDTSSYSIQGQHFDAGGAPVGDQFQVNTYTTGDQEYSAVGTISPERFVAVWQSFGSFGTDTSVASIQGQLLMNPTVFTDGFESGNTSAWSNTVP